MEICCNINPEFKNFINTFQTSNQIDNNQIAIRIDNNLINILKTINPNYFNIEQKQQEIEQETSNKPQTSHAFHTQEVAIIKTQSDEMNEEDIDDTSETQETDGYEGYESTEDYDEDTEDTEVSEEAEDIDNELNLALDLDLNFDLDSGIDSNLLDLANVVSLQEEQLISKDIDLADTDKAEIVIPNDAPNEVFPLYELSVELDTTTINMAIYLDDGERDLSYFDETPDAGVARVFPFMKRIDSMDALMKLLDNSRVHYTQNERPLRGYKVEVDIHYKLLFNLLTGHHAQ